MSKCLRIALVIPVFSLLAACAWTQPNTVESGLRRKGASTKQITMRRIRVYKGPLAYIARPDCERPRRLVVPKVFGVEALAFLKNRAPIVACGREKASIVVPGGSELDPFAIESVRTHTGFFVACVIGESRPSEVLIELSCRD